MGENEVSENLTHLAVVGMVSASTQNEALCALLFLHGEILDQDLDKLQNFVWAKKPSKLPVVFTREEVRRVLAHMDGACRLRASLLYGSGLRPMECLRLRVKDVDFGYRQVIARDGKGEDGNEPEESILTPRLRAHKFLSRGYAAINPYAAASRE